MSHLARRLDMRAPTHRATRLTITLLAGMVLTGIAWIGVNEAHAADSLAPPEDLAVHAHELKTAPVIDGVLDEHEGMPQNASLSLERPEQIHPTRRSAWDGPRDLSARGWIGTHQNSLYIALRIQDDDRFHDPSSPWWHGDSIEFFINTDHGSQQSESGYTNGCWQIFFMPLNDEVRWGVVWNGKRAVFGDGGIRGLQMAHRLRGSEGLSVEVLIPLENFGVEASDTERTLGFALALNDADTESAHPGTYMSWNAGFALYQRPEHFGTLTLGPNRTSKRGDSGQMDPGSSSLPAWLWGAGALALAACLALFLAGPGSHVLARLGLRTKLVALAAVLLLAALIHWIGGDPANDAVHRETEQLQSLATSLEPTVFEADRFGVFEGCSASERAARLRALILGESVPCAPGVDRAAMVPLHPQATFIGSKNPTYAISLAREQSFDMPAPIDTTGLRMHVALPSMERAPRSSPRLGILTAIDAQGQRYDLDVPIPRAREKGAVSILTLTLPEQIRVHSLHWKPHDAGLQATLRRIEAQSREQGKAPSTIALSVLTREGIPVLAGPRRPYLGRTLSADESASIELPVLGAQADRLWLLLESESAFPELLGDAVLARLQVHYDHGLPVQMELRNGLHMAASRRPVGIANPPSLHSRVAYGWRDSTGFQREQPALPIRLDRARRPVRLMLYNCAAGGTLKIVAATLVRTRSEPSVRSLQVATDEHASRDMAHLTSEAAPELLKALSTKTTASTRSGDTAVHLDHRFQTKDGPTVLSLSRAVPPSANDAAGRKQGLVFGCLIGALALLVLIAVDVASRFHHLTWRLGFGVILAALVPLVVTLVLVDRHARREIEAEHRRAAASGLNAIRYRFTDTQQTIQSTADAIVEQVRMHDTATERLSLKRRVTLIARAFIPPHRRASVWIQGAQIPPTVVDVGAGAQLQCARFLHDAGAQPGLHISPWDGLLAVGASRRGGDDRWVRVVVGMAIDDQVLGELADQAIPGHTAHASIKGPEGQTLAATAGGRVPALESPQNINSAMKPRLAHSVMPVVSAPSDPSVTMALMLDPANVEERLAGARMPLIWLGLLGLLLIAAAIGLVARRIADPIRALVDVTNAVRGGSFDVPAPDAGSDEVGQLSAAFDQMRMDLRQQVSNLASLRNAQERLSTTLDYGVRAEMAATLFREQCKADEAILIGARSSRGPVSVLSTQGTSDASSFDRRPVPIDATCWLAKGLHLHRPSLRGAEDVPDLVHSAQGPQQPAQHGFESRLLRHATSWMIVPLRSGHTLQGGALLGWHDSAKAQAHLDDNARVLGLGSIVANALHNAHLYQMAALDEDTGLQSASAFRSGLQRNLEDALARSTSITYMVIGLDQGEHIARRRGPEVEAALKHQCAQHLRSFVGDDMRVGAVGAHEFGVFLTNPSRSDVQTLAAKIRERLGDVEVNDGDDGLATSAVSIGVARCPEDAASVEFLMDAATRALDAAKRDGGAHTVEAGRLESAAVSMPPFEDGAVFVSRNMIEVVERARRAAASDASVLITGETGTGKEVIAALIHRRSRRSSRPMVSVNCAAFPESLLETELFGHERGAFTGAERRREGRFELADGGTLFLDEVGEMSSGAQVKLLRVLQERQFTRLGGSRPIDVDVRLLAATNRDLEDAVRKGTFRQDLYYRLNVIRLAIPPLRERRQEIPPLVEHFLRDSRRKTGRGPVSMTAGAMDVLYRHPWPGNVRELKNVVERCAVFCEDERVPASELQIDSAMHDEGSVLPPRGAPTDDLNARQRQLLDQLARVGRCTNREYYEMTGTSPRTGLRDLQNLMERGLVIREGKRRGAVYRLP